MVNILVNNLFAKIVKIMLAYFLIRKYNDSTVCDWRELNLRESSNGLQKFSDLDDVHKQPDRILRIN